MEHDSYALRIWHRRTETGVDWSCRLAHLQSDTNLRFASRQALLVYLQASLPSDTMETEGPDGSASTPTLHQPEEDKE